MARRLTTEQRLEIVQGYEAGSSTISLACHFDISDQTARNVIKENGTGLRTLSEAAFLRWEKTRDRPSAGRLRELYIGPRSGRPSLGKLAQQLNVSDAVLRQWLVEAGISVRTGSEQRRIEISVGRYVVNTQHCQWGPSKPPPPNEDPKRLGAMGYRVARPRLEQWNRQRRASRNSVPCHWCGAPVFRCPSAVRRFSGCNSSHSRKASYWHCSRPNEPRPLILSRLRELLREHPYKSLPFTRETLEKAGALVGAEEPEILEAMLQGRP